MPCATIMLCLSPSPCSPVSVPPLHVKTCVRSPTPPPPPTCHSHTIHSLSFGKPYPGMKNPLDGVAKAQEFKSDRSNGAYQYFVKVGRLAVCAHAGGLCHPQPHWHGRVLRLSASPPITTAATWPTMRSPPLQTLKSSKIANSTNPNS